MIVKRIGRCGMILGLLAAVLTAGIATSGTAGAASVALMSTGPNFSVWGRYTESSADMKVMAVGGYITVWRTWADGIWQVNRAWSPLRGGNIVPPSTNGGWLFAEVPVSNGTTTNPPIIRNSRKYDYVSPGQYAYLNVAIIKATSTGYRWQDHKGNWVDYDQHGLMVSYGDRNGVKATVVRDTQDRITGVKDTNGKQVLWYDYDATTGYLNDVRDYTGRKVQYTYTTYTPPTGVAPSWQAHPLLTQVTDARGDVWKYTYDSVGQLATETNPLGRTVSLTFSAQDRLLKKVDQNGVGITYSYNYDKATGQFYQKQTTTGGISTETWKDAIGEVVRVDIGGNTVYKLADNGRTAILTDSAGNVTNETFDEWNNVLSSTYADGSSVRYTYDSDSDVLSYTNENGVTTDYTYDANGNRLSMTEAVGTPVQRTTSYTYDQHGQLLTATRGSSTYTYTYDSYGNVASVTDPLGNKVSATYDVMGSKLTKTDALAKVWTYTYDASGNQLTARDPLGHTTTYTYDALGDRLTRTDPLGNVTTYAYDDRGDQTSITDAAGGITTMAYDKNDRLTKRIDAAGKVMIYAYDTAGRLDSITDGDGNTMSATFSPTRFVPVGIVFPTTTLKLSYDSRGRAISYTYVIDATTSRTTHIAYDKVGNKILDTTPAGQVTRYTYDALNRLSSMTNPAGGVTTYSYDAFDRIKGVTDANGNAALSCQYDAAGRMVKEQRAMGQATNFGYDADGHVTSRTNADGLVTSYSYDAAGRLVGTVYPAANGLPARTVAYTLDADGNLTDYTDGTTSGSYTYDADNRKITDSVNYGAFTLSSSYSYYANGDKKSYTGPDGKQIGYTYDAAGLLQSVAIPGQGSVVYNSYDWLVPTKVTLPGGSTRNYAYDGLMRTTDILMKDPAANTLMHQQYTYDAAGNLTAESTDQGAYSFGYDSLNRLTSANYPTQANETFGYDKIGNRTAHNGNAWAYNADNELLSRPNVTYQYDANGSQIQKTDNGVTTDYVYDGAKRLTQVKQGTGKVAQYGYDPFGRRISKTVGGTTIYYYYTDEGLAAEADSTGKVVVSYGYEPGQPWGANPLYMSTLGTYDYYLNDRIGTPQQLIQSNGARVWSAAYQAFGRATVSSGSTVTNNLRLPGQYQDAETGYHYNNYRTYDPALGRYITADPIGFVGGVNGYAYAYGNPFSLTDRSGLWFGADDAAEFLIGAAIGIAWHAINGGEGGWKGYAAAALAGGVGAWLGANLGPAIGEAAGEAVGDAVGGMINSAGGQLARGCNINWPRVAAAGLTGLGAGYAKAGAKGLAKAGASKYGSKVKDLVSKHLGPGASKALGNASQAISNSKYGGKAAGAAAASPVGAGVDKGGEAAANGLGIPDGCGCKEDP